MTRRLKQEKVTIKPEKKASPAKNGFTLKKVGTKTPNIIPNPDKSPRMPKTNEGFLYAGSKSCSFGTHPKNVTITSLIKNDNKYT